jgi:hypothetical protein
MKICDKCKTPFKKSMVNVHQMPDIFGDLKDAFGGAGHIKNNGLDFVEHYEQYLFIIDNPKRKEIFDLCEVCNKNFLKLFDKWIKTK